MLTTIQNILLYSLVAPFILLSWFATGVMLKLLFDFLADQIKKLVDR